MTGHKADRSEQGMATVELAMVSLIVATIGALVVWLISGLLVWNHCQISANEVARQHARGDRIAVARATKDVPRGATVATTHQDGSTVVTVTAEVKFGPLFTIPVVGSATVLNEDRP